MRHLQPKLKVIIISLMIIILFFSSSYVYSQTIKASDKYGNELLTRSNPVTNAVERIYRVKAPTTRYGVSIKQVNKSNIEQLGKSIIKDYEDILGISSDNLTAYRTKQGRNSSWHLGFRQLYKDVPVWGSYVRYTIEGLGVVNTISADIHPDIKLSVDPTISVDNAISTAIRAFKVDSTDTIIVRERPNLFIFPMMDKESISYYLIYKVDLLSYTPSLNMSYLVDAHSGEIVKEMNRIRFENYNNNGNVSIGFWAQNPTDSNPTTYDQISGVDVRVSLSGSPKGSDETDNYGYYDIDWVGLPNRQYKLTGEKELSLYNSYSAIQNASTTTHTFYFYPDDGIIHNWTYASDETNVFYHVKLIHDFITDSPFYFDDMDYQVQATLHLGSSYNGGSTGTDILFGTMGNHQWARSSDVIYHEYTHCIIYNLYGGWIDPYYIEHSQAFAMDEGLADYFAGTINDEARIGEYVSLDSYRDLSVTRTMDVYRDQNDLDVDKQYKNGMIIAGAIWDMHETGSIGNDLADELCFSALNRNPDDFSGMLEKILEEDDTDADLSNGTPHIDAILYAFENHLIYPSDPDVPPAAPKNLAVSNSNNHPRLDWDENTEPDLEEYDVWKDDVAGGMGWEKAATVTNNYWIDEGIGLDDPAGRIYYKVKAVDDLNNKSSFSNTVWIDGYMLEKPITTIADTEIPTSFVLNQNYPNPFNPETKIQFSLPEDSNVKLQIFNLQGQVIATLVDGAIPAGFHTAKFDATSCPSGIYFYKIVAGNFSDIKRMLLIK